MIVGESEGSGVGKGLVGSNDGSEDSTDEGYCDGQ